MVIEHVFVTTLSSNDALTKASSYLSDRGFVNEKQVSFPINQEEWSTLEMRRGKKNASRAKNVTQLPQAVRIECDRGRLTVALSIEANAVWGGSASLLGIGSGVSGNPKKMRLHTQLLNAIALGLENLLAYNGAGTADYALWDAAESAGKLAARKRTIRNLIIVGVIFTLLFGIIILAIAGSH